MKFSLNNIKAIIFDLGGVILDLSPQKSFEAFEKITGLPEEELLAYTDHQVFTTYEKGEISSDDFRTGLRNLFNVNASDQEIDNAWNAMLLDVPSDRLEMLGKLRPQLKTFVLSNTNEIHMATFDKIVAEATTGNHITNYFDAVHYSYKVGMRKPDAEIFEMVINKHSLEPSTTLFIDDTLEHIMTAKKLGLQTWHLTNQEELFSMFGNG